MDTERGEGRSFSNEAPADQAHTQLQRSLSSFNRLRLRPALPDDSWRDQLSSELHLRAVEGEFVERERREVKERAAQAPRDPKGFVAWFEALKEHGPGQGDPLFPWLSRTATYEQMRWFLEQEVAGEAGFDDLVAMAQVKISTRAKLELARNYWDELGRGREAGMHGPMLGALAREFQIVPKDETTVWEALALGNLMVAFAANRRYAFHALGALGVIELTAPGRAALVTKGLKRLGVSNEGRTYFALHSTLDIKHSEAWNREVLAPLVEENPDVAQGLAEGALIRLRAGEKCFLRYRREFGLEPRFASKPPSSPGQ